MISNEENRLASVTVSGQTTSFIYDGDGNLVKKTKPNGSKTIYVGGLYEVDKNSGGSVTRTVTYYPVGGAMRINSTLYYVLKDHLGSASVVTDARGAILGEQRYYPYGETRFTSGTIYTDKLFTGQREMTGLGIYHYQARFYSPKLGRFLSADTIVPGMSNPQNLNRYMYVLGNPLKYTDPTGHEICTDDGLCGSTNVTAYWNKVIKDLSSSYGITFTGKWKQKDKLAVVTGVILIGTRLAETTSGSADAAFSRVFKNGVNFTWGGEGAGYGCTSVTAGGCTSGASQINFWSMSNDMEKNVVHELGHAFYHAVGNAVGFPTLGNAFSRNALIRNASYGGDEALVWEQHPISHNKDGKDIPTELFADTFIAWTYDTWNPDPDVALAVNSARNEMDRIASSIP